MKLPQVRPPPVFRLLPLFILPHPILAQLGTLLGIPSLNAFQVQAGGDPQLFSLPPSGPSVTISVALCSDNQPFPRAFVSTTSGGNQIGPNDPNSNEITFSNGVGWWTGEVQSGASIRVFPGSTAAGNPTQWTFEIGIQEGDDPAHGLDSSPPVLGDTSSTQAIVFSPPFQNVSSRVASTWPNYTFPALRPSYTPLQFAPASSVIILPTPGNITSFPFFASACALRLLPQVAQTQVAFNASSSSVVRDPLIGWQTEFVIPQGLTPSTNYTVWVTQGPKISGPLYMYTKSAAFSSSCAFVHGLSYCPLVAYPIPISPSTLPSVAADPTKLTNISIIDEDTLPTGISSSIISSLTNFTTLLSTFPCGRDVYSPLHTCTECFDAYRDWACFVSLPRCSEPLPSANISIADNGFDPDDPPQAPFALKNQQTPRAAGFPQSQPYTELLPCIETCNAVGRMCPPFLGWKCPLPDVNAGQSYALGVWDSWDGTLEGRGLLGRSNTTVTDVFGRVWCNGA